MEDKRPAIVPWHGAVGEKGGAAAEGGSWFGES